MKKLLTILLILTTFAAQAAKVYINPNYNGEFLGTQAKPFNSFAQVNATTGSDILILCETTITGTLYISNCSDIYIGSYGVGTMPYINGSIRVENAVSNITIDGLTIANSDIPVNFRSYGDGITIKNCEILNCNFGIRIRAINPSPPIDYNTNVLIEKCNISYSNDDLVYIYKVNKLDFFTNDLHHANMYWKPPSTSQTIAAGDGAQLILCSKINIWNNVIDRSHTGNKFCIIISGTAGRFNTQKVPDNYIYITNNTFLQPIETDQHGCGIYVGDLFDETEVYYVFNKMTGDMLGIKFASRGVFYSNGNIYDGISFGIELSNSNATGWSVDDAFPGMPDTRRFTSKVKYIGNAAKKAQKRVPGAFR